MEIFRDEPIGDRTCGECTICCYIMKVTDTLNKPNYEDCKHLVQIGTTTSKANGSGGCQIYNERPKPCREFECLWRSGHYGIESDRPDKSGVMFVLSNERMGNYLDWLTAWLIDESILANPKIKYLFTKIAALRPFAIRWQDTFKLLGKRKEVDLIIKQLEESNKGGIEVKAGD